MNEKTLVQLSNLKNELMPYTNPAYKLFEFKFISKRP